MAVFTRAEVKEDDMLFNMVGCDTDADGSGGVEDDSPYQVEMKTVKARKNQARIIPLGIKTT